MLHTKAQGHLPSFSGEDLKSLLSLDMAGLHLCQATEIILRYVELRSPILKSLQTRFCIPPHFQFAQMFQRRCLKMLCIINI